MIYTKNKRIFFLLVLIVFISFASYLVLKTKNKMMDSDLKSIVAIMIPNGDGYKKYEDLNWPSNDYKYKEAKCFDINGNSVDNIVTFNYKTRKVNLKTDKSVECTLFFDYSLLHTLRQNDSKGVLSNEIVGDMYRYQGVAEEYVDDNHKLVDNNYICFGTNDQNTCKNNEDTYMYRIIGITSDDSLKLIKKTALPSKIAWNTTNEDKTWSESSLYAYLNKKEYLNNNMTSVIYTHAWKDGIINMKDGTGDSLYEAENKIEKSITSEIGLMYPSDYVYSLGDKNQSCLWSANSNDYAICGNSWLHIKNNQSVNSNEWTMVYYGGNYGGNKAVVIQYNAYIDAGTGTRIDYLYDVRPVFYLTNTIQLSGTGTIDNPYIIN